MGSWIFVGGLAFATTEVQFCDLFTRHGTVAWAQVITDKFTGQSRGFGLVEMSTDAEAKAAIAALHGTELDGRRIMVHEAKAQEPRSGRGTFGGSRGGKRDRF